MLGIVKKEEHESVWYVENRYREIDRPVLYGCRWRVTGARREGNVAFAPELADGLEVSYCSVRKTWSAYRKGGYLILETNNQGELLCEIPIPAPRTKLPTRYHNGHWQKCLKKTGWTNV